MRRKPYVGLAVGLPRLKYGKWQIVRTEHVINGCIYVAPEIATATATPSSVASSVGSILIS